MDSRTPDDPDDDVTIVGDHELLVELRRMAAERATVPGTPTPFPPPVLAAAPVAADQPRAARRLAAVRRPAPPAPAAAAPFGTDDWWDDADGDERSRLVWIAIAIIVGVLAVVALLVLL